MLPIPFLNNAIKILSPIACDDVVDRLNYYFTSIMLIFFCIMVSAKQYVGSPIQCWVPAQFKGGWEQYTEDYCFIQNTWYNPLDEPLEPSLVERRNLEISYYQWVPIMLALQALLFSIPNALWKLFCWQSGIDVKGILRGARACTSFTHADRDASLSKLAKFIEDSLCVQRDVGSKGCRGGVLCLKSIKGNGGFLSALYLLVKVLYLTNIIGQFYLLNAFLGSSHSFWGVQILNDLMNGRDWSQTSHFPRVTMCDFKVRVLGNTHHHTVQCVLMINMFNEKIYLFIWFWFFVVAVCTAFNLLYWVMTSMPTSRNKAVKRYLRITQDFGGGSGDVRIVEGFVKDDLGPDGVLLLRFIGGHAGDLISTDLTCILWKYYTTRLMNTQQDRSPLTSNRSLVNSVIMKDADECETILREAVIRPTSDRHESGSDPGFSETLCFPKNQPLNLTCDPLLANQIPSNGYRANAVLPKTAIKVC